MSFKYCRLCLENYTNVVDVFKENCDGKHNVQNVVFKLFSFWINPGDKSTVVCLSCLEVVKTFYEFYKKVKNVQKNISQDKWIPPTNSNNSENDNHSDISVDETEACSQDVKSFEVNINDTDSKSNSIYKDLKTMIKQENIIDNVDEEDIEKGNYILEDKSLPIISIFENETEFYKKIKTEDFEDIKFQKNSDDEMLVDGNEAPLDSDDNLLAYSRHSEKKAERRRRKLKKAQIKKEKSLKQEIKDLLSGRPENKNAFPTELIKDGKVVFKGAALDNLILQFFSLHCELCQNLPKFKDWSKLIQHYDVQHNTKGYLTCCDTRFYHHRSIYMHMARHLQPSAFECPICKKTVTRPHTLKLHMQTHLPESEKPHKCDQCDKRFVYAEGLNNHKLTHIPIEERDPIECQICKKIFTLPASFTTHMNAVHTNANHLCSECGRSFRRKNELNFHLLSHDVTGKYKVKCQQCGLVCKNPPTLKNHMKQHRPDRLRCTLCDYTSARQNNLNMHIRVKHTDEKPYVCVVCGKQFKLKSVLTVHMVQHTGEHKYACKFCPKTFASPGNYHHHRKRMHLDEFKRTSEMRMIERFKAVDVVEPKTGEVDVTKTQAIAREYLKKISDKNASKKSESKL